MDAFSGTDSDACTCTDVFQCTVVGYQCFGKASRSIVQELVLASLAQHIPTRAIRVWCFIEGENKIRCALAEIVDLSFAPVRKASTPPRHREFVFWWAFTST